MLISRFAEISQSKESYVYIFKCKKFREASKLFTASKTVHRVFVRQTKSRSKQLKPDIWTFGI